MRVDRANKVIVDLDSVLHHGGTASPGRSPATPVRSTENTEKPLSQMGSIHDALIMRHSTSCVPRFDPLMS